MSDNEKIFHNKGLATLALRKMAQQDQYEIIENPEGQGYVITAKSNGEINQMPETQIPTPAAPTPAIPTAAPTPVQASNPFAAQVPDTPAPVNPFETGGAVPGVNPFASAPPQAVPAVPTIPEQPQQAVNVSKQVRRSKPPKPDSIKGKIWAIGDDLSRQLQRPPNLDELANAAVQAGFQFSMVNSVFNAWRRYYGITGKPSLTPEEQAEANRKKEERAAKKAEREARKAAQVIKNGIIEPTSDTTSGKIWAILNTLSQTLQRPVEKTEVLNSGQLGDISPVALNIQFPKWQQFYGLIPKPPEIEEFSLTEIEELISKHERRILKSNKILERCYIRRNMLQSPVGLPPTQ